MESNDEHLLSDSPRRAIVRIGSTVHRPVGWWTPAVHDLLRYLEGIGFPYVPRVLGVDTQGREILSFIEGESGAVGWTKILSDDGLHRFARLLRAYHDAVADYRPPTSSVWTNATGGVQPGEIICHGDFGPWNLVWRGEEPVGIVDWDMAMPAPPRFDVVYALKYAAPFRSEHMRLRGYHLPAVPNRKHRIQVFVQAYG